MPSGAIHPITVNDAQPRPSHPHALRPRGPGARACAFAGSSPRRWTPARGETTLEHAKAPIARLEPALRLAARGVTKGDLSAIDRLLRVLDRLDKYSAAPGAEETYDENGRERLLTKLNTMAQRMLAARQAGMLDEEGRYRPPTAEAGLDASGSLDSKGNSDPRSSARLDET